MLSHLDRSLFPDRCEVIEVIPSQRYVYPIFKNGSSNIYITAQKKNWRIRFNEQIQRIDSIDVIIRNPQQRLISGINTFIESTIRDNPTLDTATVQWFALNYLYLNNHYCPQFMWLVNLSRFVNSNATLNFLAMSDLDSITDYKGSLHFETIPDQLVAQVNQLSTTEMYQRIDSVVFDAIGQSMTVGQLWKLVKDTDPDAYNYVVGYAQQLLKTTYVLS